MARFGRRYPARFLVNSRQSPIPGAAGTPTQVNVTTGAITISGANANVNARTHVDTTVGTVTIAGANANVNARTQVNATTGAVTISGANVNVNARTHVDTTTGSITITGANAGVSASVQVNTTVGTIVIAGANANVGVGQNVNVTPGAITIAGANVNINARTQVDTTTGSITIAPANANVNAKTQVDTTTGAVTIAGSNVNVWVGVWVQTTPGAITITGYNASVTTGEAQVKTYISRVERVDGSKAWTRYKALKDILANPDGYAKNSVEYRSERPSQTTGSVPVNVFAIDIADNSHVRAMINVTGTSTAGADKAPYTALFDVEVYRAGAGGVALFQYPRLSVPVEANDNWDVALSLLEDQVLVQATGETAVTIDWELYAHLSLRDIGTALSATTSHGALDLLDYEGIIRGKSKPLDRLVYAREVQTIDATPTTIHTLTPPRDGWYTVQASVSGDDGVSQRSDFLVRGVFDVALGTPVLVGSAQLLVNQASPAGVTATLDVSGSTIRTRVTGDAATTIDWDADIDVHYFRAA